MMYTSEDQDKAFMAMMHEFVESHRDRPATTESFKADCRKAHDEADGSCDNNGRLDWFFDEWVYGTQVPRYHFEYQLSPQDRAK